MNIKEIEVFVINIDERTDRMVIFNEEFKKFFGEDKTYIRISAEVGTPSRKFIANSHKKAIQLAKDMELPYVIILEDDVKFTSGESFYYAQNAFECIPSEWDILLGGTYSETLANDERGEWLRLKDFSGLHWYAVNAKAYDKILSMDNDMHIDRWLVPHGHLKCYRTKKLFAIQYNGYSDNVKRSMIYDDLLNGRPLA